MLTMLDVQEGEEVEDGEDDVLVRVKTHEEASEDAYELRTSSLARTKSQRGWAHNDVEQKRHQELIQKVFEFSDTDKSGYLRYEEMNWALHIPLSPYRLYPLIPVSPYPLISLPEVRGDELGSAHPWRPDALEGDVSLSLP